MSVSHTAYSTSRGDKDGTKEAHHQNAKHLRNQPPIPTDSAPVFQQLSLRALHIIHHILGVGVDPLDHLALFRHHSRQLAEDAAEFADGALDGFDGLAALLDVGIACGRGWLSFFHEEKLRVGGVLTATIGSQRGR